MLEKISKRNTDMRSEKPCMRGFSDRHTDEGLNDVTAPLKTNIFLLIMQAKSTTTKSVHEENCINIKFHVGKVPSRLAIVIKIELSMHTTQIVL